METQFSTHSRTRRSSEGPTTADLLNQMNQLNQTISSMIVGGLNQMLTASRTPAATQEQPHTKTHRHENCCDCPECGQDECYCRCCIGDADLVVYARLFELRVIPITLVNERRREKNIRLELSEFRTRGGDTLGVRGVIIPPTEFVLPPCGEAQVIIAVETNPAGQELPPGSTSEQPQGIARFQTAAAAAEGRKIPDVDECRVLYADLRVEGCDIRPIRIALALLPRDCDEYVIDCGCTCC